jgi:hypothetical protein
MFKKALFLGIVSGLLAGVAGMIYAKVYTNAADDFSKVASVPKIYAGSLIGGLLAAIGYSILLRLLKEKGEIVFNLLFTILSFISILGPFAAKLNPRDYDQPALFYGLVIPMHFFPALAWYTLKPIFIRK